MKCRTIQKKLSAYLDEELPDEERARMDEHIRSCPKCVDALVRRRALHRLLDEQPGIEVPPAFARRMRARAERHLVDPTEKLIPLPARLSPALARAAAVVALVVGVSLGGFTSTSFSRARTEDLIETPARTSADASAELLDTVPPGSVTEAYLKWLGEWE